MHNDQAEGRDVLSLSLSTDGGAHWTRALEIERESGAEFSYPAVIEDSQGRLQLTYTWKKENIARVMIEF